MAVAARHDARPSPDGGASSPRRARRQRVRTPTVLQMEQVECGAACLAMVLGHHGRWVPLEELRVACGVSRDGTKASNLVRAAHRYGVVAKGFSKETDELPTLPLPFVVFWNFNHFVVVDGFERGRIRLNDPATGPRSVTEEEFDEAFTGVVLVFRPGPDFSPGGERRSGTRYVLRRLAGSGAGVAAALAAGLGLVVLGIVVPLLTEQFVNTYVAEGSRAWVAAALLGIGAAAVGRAVLTFVEGRCLLRIWERMSTRTARELLWHVLRLPMPFFAQRQAGELSARVGVNETLVRLLALDIARGLLDVAVVAGFTVLMIMYDIVLTAVAVAVGALNVVALGLLARRHADLSRRLSLEHGVLVGASLGGLYMVETLKATGSEADFFSRWGGYQAKMLQAQEAMEVSSHSLRILPSVLTTLATALVLIVGGHRIIGGDFSVGELVAFQVVMVSFLQPFTQLLGLAGSLLEARADVEQLDDVLLHPVDPRITAEAVPEPPHESLAALELRGVSFGYSAVDEPLIENLTALIVPGGRLAIVGRTGSGKSTVAKLVTGLYEPWSGEIVFGGRPRAAYARDRLAQASRSVDQDLFLFEGTVRENLTLWDSTISDSAIERAAADACILDTILARQGGFESLVAEGGSNFSGGERQRLEIARALATEPQILVLDEATSGLDTATESSILENIRRRGCTCLVVAHRLSTIREADEIIVLDHGKVLERGTHDELLARGAAYTRLVEAE